METIAAPFDHIRGINTLKELWIAEQIKRSEMITYWMELGVRFDVAQSTHIDINVSIGAGTRLGAGVHLLSGTVIGKNCLVEPFCLISNSTIGDNSSIFSHSVITNSKIEQQCNVGPFAHVHKPLHLASRLLTTGQLQILPLIQPFQSPLPLDLKQNLLIAL